MSSSEQDPSHASGELQAITAVARQLIDAWYTGSAEHMRACLHPDLVKRSLARDPASGALGLRPAADASMLVEWTRQGGGSDLPPEQRTCRVSLQDVFREVASVKVESHDYVDYLHLAKVEGTWLIVQDLWQLRRGELAHE